jgi:pimeloyl-ACP methyl ester carboxylesterase
MLPYTESGSGDTVLLFLHFFGSSRREWHHVIDSLKATHRCIAADMPGFGEAAHITGYSVTEMAAQVETLVQRFAPAPVVLIGHSMSGKVSMVVAATPPANLQQLILVGPSPLQPEPVTEDARATMTIANTTRERAEAFVKGGAHSDLSAEDFQTAVEDVLRANPEAWKAWPQSGAKEDWSSRITSLGVPTTLIVGEYDKAIPIDFQRQHTLPLVEATGGKLITVKNAAHLLPYEASAELTQAIQEVLADHVQK